MSVCLFIYTCKLLACICEFPLYSYILLNCSSCLSQFDELLVNWCCLMMSSRLLVTCSTTIHILHYRFEVPAVYTMLSGRCVEWLQYKMLLLCCDTVLATWSAPILTASHFSVLKYNVVNTSCNAFMHKNFRTCMCNFSKKVQCSEHHYFCSECHYMTISAQCSEVQCSEHH